MARKRRRENDWLRALLQSRIALAIGLASAVIGIYAYVEDKSENDRGPAGPPSLAVEGKLRPDGQPNGWAESLSVHPGDSLEYITRASNSGPGTAYNAVVTVQLGEGLEYVPGSCLLATYDDRRYRRCSDRLVNGGGLRFGKMGPNSGALTRYRVRVSSAAPTGISSKTKFWLDADEAEPTSEVAVAVIQRLP